MALALKYKADASGNIWVTPPRKVLDSAGFDTAMRSRVIASLEKAGLVEVRRRAGRKLLVRLRLWPTEVDLIGRGEAIEVVA